MRGGSNRKSTRELTLAGGYRADRHGKTPDVSEFTPARLVLLRGILDRHIGREQAMSRRLEGLDPTQLNMAARLTRAIRQETATIIALVTTLDRLERLAASEEPAPPSPWDEFLGDERSKQ